jgi:hypothetical protein
MLKFASVVSVAFASAAVFSLPVSGAEHATLSEPVVVGKFEVRNADRGPVKRVKVFYSGSHIATLVARRGETSSFCCTADGCKEVENLNACTTLKISCDAQGWCTAS